MESATAVQAASHSRMHTSPQTNSVLAKHEGQPRYMGGDTQPQSNRREIYDPKLHGKKENIREHTRSNPDDVHFTDSTRKLSWATNHNPTSERSNLIRNSKIGSPTIRRSIKHSPSFDRKDVSLQEIAQTDGFDF